jgi:hypothetical protein
MEQGVAEDIDEVAVDLFSQASQLHNLSQFHPIIQTIHKMLRNGRLDGRVCDAVFAKWIHTLASIP